jgi:membrane protein DedA with SNARE-associated domain
METVEPFETILDFLELLISRYGAMGIAAAMFAESAGVPFASTVVLLTAGSMILRGSVTFWPIFWASTIGITLGSIVSYFIGMVGSVVGSRVRYNIFNQNQDLFINENNNKSKIRFLWERYGNFSIFMAQLWGFSRTFISFPAGAMHMNFYIFIIYTFLGGMLFSLLAIGASIVLTHTMGLTLRLLKTVAGFSPWLLLIPIVVIAGLLSYLIYRKFKNKNKGCPQKENFKADRFGER